MNYELHEVILKEASMLAYLFRKDEGSSLLETLLRMAEFALKQCGGHWIKCSKRMPLKGDEIVYWCKTGGNNYRRYMYVTSGDLERMTDNDYWLPMPTLNSED